MAGGIGGTTDEDAVGVVEIRDRGSLGQELGVAQDVEASFAGAVQDGRDGFRRLDGDGRLLDDDLRRVGDFGDPAGSQLPIGEVGGAAGADADFLRRGVDGDWRDAENEFVLEKR